MNVTIVSIIFFITSLNVLLGVLSIIKSKDKKPALYFSGLIVCSVIWSVFISLIESTNDPERKLIFARLSFLAPIFLPVFLYNFIRFFPYKSNVFFNNDVYAKIFTLWLIIFSAILDYCAIFTKRFIVSAELEDRSATYSYGGFYLWFFIYFASIISILLYAFFIKFKNSDQLYKLKIKYVLAGFISTVTLALFTNLLLPLLGVDALSSFGPISTIFLFGFTSYSIIYHRLFDIGTFVAKIIQYLLIGIVLFTIVFVIRTIQYEILNLTFYDPLYLFIDFVACIIVGILITKIIEFITKTVNKIIAGDEVNLYVALKEIETSIGQILIENEAIKRILILANSYFPFSNVHFLKKTNGKYSQIQKDTIKAGIQLKDEALLNEIKGTIITQEAENTEILKFCSENNIAIIAELAQDMYIIFDNKANDIAYTKIELDNIEIIIEKLRSIFLRIQYHEKIEDFNSMLKKQVDEQTKELKKNIEELKEAQQRERDMLDILGHELRTPLSIIQNALGLIEMKGKDGKLTLADIQSYTGKGKESVRREIEIVENMLSATKISSGQMTFNNVSMDMIDVVNDSMDANIRKAEERKLYIRFNKPEKPELFPQGYGDRTATQRIMDNLLTNAIKYTDIGGIDITVDYDNDFVSIHVKDTGKGIPKEAIKNLGQKFYRVDQYLGESDAKLKMVRPGGTGIGLYVTFGLVREMKGKIWIDSEVGKGSTFHFSLPKYKGQEVKQQGGQEADVFKRLGLKK